MDASASVSPAGLTWIDAVRTPKVIAGSQMVFEALRLPGDLVVLHVPNLMEVDHEDGYPQMDFGRTVGIGDCSSFGVCRRPNLNTAPCFQTQRTAGDEHHANSPRRLQLW